MTATSMAVNNTSLNVWVYVIQGTIEYMEPLEQEKSTANTTILYEW